MADLDTYIDKRISKLETAHDEHRDYREAQTVQYIELENKIENLGKTLGRIEESLTAKKKSIFGNMDPKWIAIGILAVITPLLNFLGIDTGDAKLEEQVQQLMKMIQPAESSVAESVLDLSPGEESL